MEQTLELKDIDIVLTTSCHKHETSVELHFLKLFISMIYESYHVSPYKTIDEQYSFLKNPYKPNDRSSTNNNL